MADGLQSMEQHFVNQYSQNVLYLASQEMSKLRGTVLEESMESETKFFDQFGTVEVLERDTRFGDSPVNPTSRESRQLTTFAYESGEPLDNYDAARTMNDPTNPIVRRQAQAFARQFDRTIITAGLGTAYVGRKTSTAVTLPASQVIAVNNHDYDAGSGDVGLTLGKLIATRDLFGNNDVEADVINMVVTQSQLSNLLTEDKITSADYAAIKALVNGQIDTFMGIKFHRVTNSLLPISGGVRSAMAYTSDGIVLGIGQDVKARIGERADKSYNWYAYMDMFIGATRTEEVKVAKILCKE